MFDTMTRYLTMLGNGLEQRAVRAVVRPLVDRYSTQPLTSAGLVINAGGALVAKIGAADFYACVQGVLVKIAAGTALPALTGVNAAAGGFNVACFFVDSGGTVTVAGGTGGATLGAVVFPEPPAGKALIGFLIITYASAFTGGTTALDTATTVYVSPLGPFDPTVLV
jgi:hypothetical protein